MTYRSNHVFVCARRYPSESFFITGSIQAAFAQSADLNTPLSTQPTIASEIKRGYLEAQICSPRLSLEYLECREARRSQPSAAYGATDTRYFGLGETLGEFLTFQSGAAIFAESFIQIAARAQDKSLKQQERKQAESMLSQQAENLMLSASMAASYYRIIVRSAADLGLDMTTLATAAGLNPEVFDQRLVVWKVLHPNFDDFSEPSTHRPPHEIAGLVFNYSRLAENPGKLGVGFTPLSAELAKIIKLDKVGAPVIALVLPGAVADKAGLLTGDVIVAVDGTSVLASNFSSILAPYGHGQTASIEIWRNAAAMRLQVTF